MSLLLAALLPLVAPASAAAPREQLKTLTAQLQTAPKDDALRGRIIALAKTLKPAPAIPEEARRAFIRGNTAFKDAKSGADYTRASARFEEASLIAPWWADPYFNFAKADSAAGDHDNALRALKFYVAAAATAAEKRQGQDMIYELEERSAGKDAEAAAARSNAAAAQARTETSIEGTWWWVQSSGVVWVKPQFVVTRNGNSFEMKFLDGTPVLNLHATETTLRYSYQAHSMVTVDLRREGDYLVGSSSVGSVERFTRK